MDHRGRATQVRRRARGPHARDALGGRPRRDSRPRARGRRAHVGALVATSLRAREPCRSVRRAPGGPPTGAPPPLLRVVFRSRQRVLHDRRALLRGVAFCEPAVAAPRPDRAPRRRRRRRRALAGVPRRLRAGAGGGPRRRGGATLQHRREPAQRVPPRPNFARDAAPEQGRVVSARPRGPGSVRLFGRLELHRGRGALDSSAGLEFSAASNRRRGFESRVPRRSPPRSRPWAART